jgi:hypothetical protein
MVPHWKEDVLMARREYRNGVTNIAKVAIISSVRVFRSIVGQTGDNKAVRSSMYILVLKKKEEKI